MPDHEVPKAYDPKQHEDAIYAAWEHSGFFNPDKLPGERTETFSIAMAPPNVTGVLHLGHALEDSLTDAMVRFQRMRGKKTLYIPGTDHAAIPTQAKVEKMLMKEGIENPRKEFGREVLVEKIRAYAEQSRATILNQVKKMGASCDWSRLAYTFDETRNVAVNELFRRMYHDGLIYRGYRVVNWSVKGQSTCSDDEIVHVERTTVLYTFTYSKDFPIVISSTQPETKLGDTAVAVHPDDTRYQKFIGQTFTVDVGAAEPLTIRVIVDEGVDPKFGTGALGVTPAHSAIDFAMYEKQKAKSEPIGIVPVIGIDGRMTQAAGSRYEGLTTEEARAKFVVWLKEQGLLQKEEEISQNVGTSDRYGDVIEALPMTQWWLDVNKTISGRGKSLRDLMREAVTTGLDGNKNQKVTITPDRCTKMYLDRVENLRDWCLSRQIWWGHRIPVWYRGEEVFVGSEAPEGDGWEQDPDTLDTWFSSGSWTFSTLGWPNDTTDLHDFHPTTWITMGYEILYLWLMRMILMSAYTLKQIPFHDAYIHGLLRDQHGEKFSKSSGNGIDPIEVINTYGCDALRLSVVIGNTPGNDSRFSLEKVEGARNFVNKMWNISRFIQMSSKGLHHVEAVEAKTLADKWILSRLEQTVNSVTHLFEQYDFSLATELLRDFTWSDFADWYLEIAKIEKDKEDFLCYLLERILILWHPFMPFVTEAIWKQAGFSDQLLMIAQWPKGEENKEAKEITEAFESLKEIISSIRNLRSEYKIEPAKHVTVTIVSEKYAAFIDEQAGLIRHLARVESLRVCNNTAAPENCASTVLGDTTIFLSLEGLVDTEKEKARLTKELAETKGYAAQLSEKLGNDEFKGKAPEHVIASMQQKLDEATQKIAGLEQQLQSL